MECGVCGTALPPGARACPACGGAPADFSIGDRPTRGGPGPPRVSAPGGPRSEIPPAAGTSAPIVVTCPGCGKRFRAANARVGAPGRCPDCGKTFRIGETPGASPPAPTDRSLPSLASLGDRVTAGGAADAAGALAALPPGTRVADRYAIGAPLGRGGMGVVYKAQDSRPSRPVALKFLALHEQADEAAVTRFLQEAEVIARLSHLNIIQVYEVGEWTHANGMARYIAMEFVAGGTLREAIRKRGKFPVPDASDLMRQVARAVSHAHRQGVIHRDLKPANILLTAEGVPKLADFGLAKGVTESELSRSGYGLGTLGFMSPEQRRDAKSVDHRTDIYAWGATFYQVVTGKDPLAWDPDEIPGPVDAVIRRCLKDREGRYFSMEEALAALEEALRNPAAAGKARPRAGQAAGACPQCGAPNPPDTRYCQGCGAGLFLKCPACEKEYRAGLRFCGACGAEVEKIVKARDHVTQGDRLAAEGHYSRAVKELETAAALQPDDRAIQQRLGEVRDAAERLARRRAEIERAFESEDFTAAEALAREILQLAPNDERAAEVLRDAPRLRAWRDADAALAEARVARERRDLATALARAEAAEALYAASQDDGGIVDEDLAQLLAELRDAKRECDAAVVAATAAMADHRYEAARESLGPVLRKWSYERASRLDETAADKLATRERAMQEAREALARGRYDVAADRVEQARRIRPDPETAALLATVRRHVARRRAVRVALAGSAAAVVAIAVWIGIGWTNRGRLSTAAEHLRKGEFGRALAVMDTIGGTWVSRATRDGYRSLAGAGERAREAEARREWGVALGTWDGAIETATALGVDGFDVHRKACLAAADAQFREILDGGRQALEKEDWELASKAATEALAIRPGNDQAETLRRAVPERKREVAYRKAMDRARAAEQSSKWEAAEDAAKVALGSKPGDPEAEALASRARTAIVERDYQAAMRDGKVALDAEHWDDASRDAGAALTLKPGDASATTLRDAATEGKRKAEAFHAAVARARSAIDDRRWADADAALAEAESLGRERETVLTLRRTATDQKRRDPSSFKALHSLPTGSAVCSLAFDPEGRRLAVGGTDGSIRVYDVQSGREAKVLKAHGTHVMGMAFSGDGKTFVSASLDDSIRIWDAGSWQAVRRISGGGAAFWCLDVSPDGAWLAAGGGDMTIRLIDLSSGRELQRLAGHDGPVASVAFVPPGHERLVSAGQDGTLHSWDVSGRPARRAFASGEAPLWAVARGPGWLAAASDDGRVQLWDPRTGDKQAAIAAPPGSARCVTAWETGRLVATGGRDRALRVWDVVTGRNFELGRHEAPIRALRVSPDGTRLASGATDGMTTIWGAPE